MLVSTENKSMEGATMHAARYQASGLADHDVDALTLSRLLDDSGETVDLLLTSLAKLDGKPRMIVKRDGSLVARSDCAQRLLRGPELIKLVRGRIAFSKHIDASQFARILDAPGDEPRTLMLYDAQQQEHLIFRAVAVDAEHVCIALQKASCDHYVKLHDLSAAFRLTQSETRVVEDLFNGLSPQEIAERNKISIHTVRSHLRRCYDKLNITSREQLWHRLSAYQL